MAFCQISFSQLLSGDVINEGRSLLTKTDFKINSTTEGVVVYDITVNREGKVTSTLLKIEQSTINSTPLKMQAVNLLKSFKFEPNTRYPQVQHVLVKITFVKLN